MLASESLFCVHHQNIENCRQGKASRLNMQSIQVFAVMLFVRWKLKAHMQVYAAPKQECSVARKLGSLSVGCIIALEYFVKRGYNSQVWDWLPSDLMPTLEKISCHEGCEEYSFYSTGCCAKERQWNKLVFVSKKWFLWLVILTQCSCYLRIVLVSCAYALV